MLNGRFNQSDYTCHRKQGSSMVDYIIVDHASLKYVTTFYQINPDSILDVIERDIGYGNKVPDHSILIMKFRLGNEFLTDSTNTL